MCCFDLLFILPFWPCLTIGRRYHIDCFIPCCGRRAVYYHHRSMGEAEEASRDQASGILYKPGWTQAIGTRRRWEGLAGLSNTRYAAGRG